MADLSEVFGDGKLSLDEFLIKAGEMGGEFGDVGELRRQYEAELSSVKCSSALERELDRSGVRNRELVSKLIDMGSVSVDGEGVHGIKEQIDSLRQSAPYLFESVKPAPTPFRTGMTHGRDVLDSDSLSDSEYYRRVKNL